MSAPASPALKQRLLGAVKLGVAAAMLLGSAGHLATRALSSSPVDTLSIAGLSDQAVVSLMRSGKTVALLATGTDDATALAIAASMGNAVVAPVVGGPKDLAAALEHSARALKAKGFRGIAFVGDGRDARRAQAEVAAKLGREWADSRIRVLDAGATGGKADLIKRVMARLDA